MDTPRYYGFKNVNTEHLLFLHYRYSNGSLKRCYFSLKAFVFCRGRNHVCPHAEKGEWTFPQKIDNKDYWVFFPTTLSPKPAWDSVNGFIDLVRR